MRGVVVFDLDDTLYLERDYVASGFRAVDAHLRSKHGVSGFGTVAWGLFEAGVRGDTFDRALGEVGRREDPELVAELVSVYREHAPEISLQPDASRAFARCRSLALGIGLISDGPLRSQSQKVSALGLRAMLDHVVLSDAYGREAWKPSSVPYAASEQAFPTCDAFAYVADNPVKDFVTARARGWRTVRLARPGAEHEKAVAREGYDADTSARSLDDIDFGALFAAQGDPHRA